MYEVDSSTVQLVSQCKLPTKQLHDLKWPAFGLTALSWLTAAFTVRMYCTGGSHSLFGINSKSFGVNRLGNIQERAVLSVFLLIYLEIEHIKQHICY